MNRTSATRFLPYVLGLILVGAALATFWPVLENDFINYDDPDYVTANSVVKSGLSREGIHWAFTTGHASNWHPLTWLSHMLDVSVYGTEPRGHHLTNLGLHCVNAMLLLLWLHQLTGALWRSTAVAALFALHPLHVESVAWIAERKDLLSALFGLLTLMAYTRYAQNSKNQCHRTEAWCGMALIFFTMGLMSKPMLVTWPFVFLLLDYWPLKRINLETNICSTKFWKLNQKLGWEKLPFLALSTVSSIITVSVQHGAMAKTEIVPLSERLYNAILAYANYLQQTAWPSKLAVFYPFPASFQPLQLVISTGVLITISVIAVRAIRAHPFLIFGWLWFLGTLIPVIGLVQVGAQARADRYTYLPLIGIFLMVSWSLFWLNQQHAWLKRAIPVVMIMILGALGITSHAQVRHWRNDRALCTHAAAVTTGNYMAWGGLGIADVKAANWPSAMTNLMRAYEYAKPHHTERSVSYYIGVAFQMQGKPKEALPYLETCIVSAEMEPERNHRLGLSLMDAGRMIEAEAAIKAALEAKPQHLDYNLGMAAFRMAEGNTIQAESIYSNSIAMHPDEPAAHKAYGDFLTLVNRHAEAESRYAMAMKLKPVSEAYLKAYASSLQHNGRLDRAAEQYEKAFGLAQPAAQELLNLAEIYVELGQPRKTLNCYDRAIRQEPDSVPVLNNLAWFLATCPEDDIRNGSRAVELAEHACKITDWNAAVLMGTLAAAYAEAGRFSDAVAATEKAIARARDDRQDDVAKRNAELRELYLNKIPYREK